MSESESVYIRNDLKDFVSESEYPYRDYELIEFLKKVLEKNEVGAVTFDLENHIVSFTTKLSEEDEFAG